jgi:hypothetical protein
MKFFFTLGYVAHEWRRLEVEAATFKEACDACGQLQYEGERGEIVDSETVDCGVITRVVDENGTSYDPREAEKLAWTEE